MYTFEQKKKYLNFVGCQMNDEVGEYLRALVEFSHFTRWPASDELSNAIIKEISEQFDYFIEQTFISKEVYQPEPVEIVELIWKEEIDENDDMPDDITKEFLNE